MAKKAQETTKQLYKYPIEDVFRVITESIIKQMQGPGTKNNLNLINPLGKESNYLIKQGTREIAVHFEVTAFDPPTHFAYIHGVDRTMTEIEWSLEDYDSQTTNVTYTERASNTSFLNFVLKLINKKKFERTSNGYFYKIDSVLEEEAKKKAKGKGSKNIEADTTAQVKKAAASTPKKTTTKPKTEKATTAKNTKTATKKAPVKKTQSTKNATTKKAAIKNTQSTKNATTKKATAKKTTVDYEAMTVPQLREQAKKQKVSIPASTRRKADIIELLKK